jgi:hypothetical protein
LHVAVDTLGDIGWDDVADHDDGLVRASAADETAVE